MKLIIGGAYQGKTKIAYRYANFSEQPFLTQDCADGNICSVEEMMQAKVVTQFHQFVKRGLKDGTDLHEVVKRLIHENPSVIVVCNELGCGLVPMDAFDREWREETGRLCCLLAEASDSVIRVFAGIEQKIK